MGLRTRGSTLLLAATVIVAAVSAVLWVRRGDSDAGLPPDVGVVRWVVDGDTIEVEIGGRSETVRLIGIDTPEIHVEDGPPECYGPEAAAFTRNELPEGTEVRLARDVVGRDHYDRLLAYVYRRSDGVFVNELIVASGHATPLAIAPNDAHAARFVAAAHAAAAADAGLWAACTG